MFNFDVNEVQEEINFNNAIKDMLRFENEILRSKVFLYDEELEYVAYKIKLLTAQIELLDSRQIQLSK